MTLGFALLNQCSIIIRDCKVPLITRLKRRSFFSKTSFKVLFLNVMILPCLKLFFVFQVVWCVWEKDRDFYHGFNPEINLHFSVLCYARMFVRCDTVCVIGRKCLPTSCQEFDYSNGLTLTLNIFFELQNIRSFYLMSFYPHFRTTIRHNTARLVKEKYEKLLKCS